MDSGRLIRLTAQLWVFNRTRYPAMLDTDPSASLVFAATHVLRHQAKIPREMVESMLAGGDMEDVAHKCVFNALRLVSLVGAKVETHIEQVLRCWNEGESHQGGILAMCASGQLTVEVLKSLGEFRELVLAAVATLEPAEHGEVCDTDVFEGVCVEILAMSVMFALAFGYSRASFEARIRERCRDELGY